MTVYSYDENGRLVKTKRPDGTVETRTYDKAGRLISILDKCGDTVVNRQEYSYDASGNITAVKALERGLLDFGAVASAEMTYDANNRLLTSNGEEVKYDKDGNMTYGLLQGKMEEFAYDCRNRLVKAGDTSYEYDAENNRTAVITGTKRTEYVVNSQPELSQVLQSRITDGEREETTYYLYGKGLLSQENVTGGYLTYHFNNVGSTMAVTDQEGKVKYSYHYTPYGELLEGEYSDMVPFLYNGQFGVTTDGNGLYYMRARYYNVDIKRFVNQDVLTGTLERVSSLNRYAYVEGNPVSFLDPFGLAKSIYSEAYSFLSDMEGLLLKFNTALDGFGFLDYKMDLKGISSKISEGITIVELIANLTLYCMEIGVCIGWAWEGIYENDYNKVDSSYERMKEIGQSILLMLGTSILDSLYDKTVYGFINDIIGLLQDL